MDALNYGGIEAGGTKFVCCVSDARGNILDRIELPTRSVDTTIASVADFYKDSKIVSLGVGSFGPIDLDNNSSTFGHILNTPKTGWVNTNLKGLLEDSLKVPVVIDTDVNCAALGEMHYGSAINNSNFIYLTVGTGIGGSLVVEKEIYNGTSHLEMGHMYIKHEPFENFQGVCPYHKDCLEGIASGPALENRWGEKAELILNDRAWELEAQYLGCALSNLILILQPELFIIGGGVIKHNGLIEMVRDSVKRNTNSYVDLPDLDTYIISSTTPDNAILGAVSLVIK